MANGDQDMATDELMETEGLKVLAVDDDPIYLHSLTQMLRRCGYEVTAKPSPADAVREVEKNPNMTDFIMTVVQTRGRGMDGLGLLKRLGKRYPVVLMFSGEESMETRIRGNQGGACYLLEKPLRDTQIYFLWQHVVRWRLNAAAAATANANPHHSLGVHLDDSQRKRGQGVNDSNKGKGASEGGLQLGTTKKKKLEWTAEMHELFVNAVTQLKTTGDDTPNNIREFLEIDGIYVTTAQVSSHLQKYRSDHRTGGLSTMPSSRPSHSNSTSKNYSESQECEGSYRIHMRSQGARDINQTSWLSGGASQVDYGVLGNWNQTTNLGAGVAYGHGYYHGNGIGDINGYDHHYGIVSANDYGQHYGNGNNTSYGYPHGNSSDNNCGNGNGGRGGVITSGSMVSASLLSNLAPPVQHGMRADASAGQASVVHPQNLDRGFLNWANTSSETAGTSGGGGVVTDRTTHGLTMEE
ncbi:two-component response regulator ORR27-like [Triticum aestivum]|uniref:two-component response regulator ORR27-like n=1 Tax=Triticum aestivum TaxID=4565 RepID=UPI001D02F11A|nr:two-component response regulator ORR27-like [Triticum aestivum]